MDQLSQAIAELKDARKRTLELCLDLDDAQWMGPRLGIVNPMRWEVAHVAWFQERWMLRHSRGRAPLRADGDALYDSAKVAHDTRWDLPLPDRAGTLAYMEEILARSVEAARDGEHRYFLELSLFHEDMHDEAFTYTRQTLGYPAPRFALASGAHESRNLGPGSGGLAAIPASGGPWPGDAVIPGGTYRLGAQPDTKSFVFDNEKWAHEVRVAPFRMARAPVTNEEFARFVDDRGYARRELWTPEGWAWREEQKAQHPVYWLREGGGWRLRRYDGVTELSPHHPVIHVAWHEAVAYCRWARRRLPTEAEWELAASTFDKQRFPWGDAPPTPAHANLDGRAGGTVDVAAHPEGDSPYGCRQMFGNVWEWTSTRFAPYPGFVVDPYAEYSAPWFETPHMVLRGGCWVTRARLLRNTWRNFYPPGRRDVLAGFRTCAE